MLWLCYMGVDFWVKIGGKLLVWIFLYRNAKSHLFSKNYITFSMINIWKLNFVNVLKITSKFSLGDAGESFPSIFNFITKFCKNVLSTNKFEWRWNGFPKLQIFWILIESPEISRACKKPTMASHQPNTSITIHDKSPLRHVIEYFSHYLGILNCKTMKHKTWNIIINLHIFHKIFRKWKMTFLFMELIS
jgi:hypothetical protein